MAYVMLVLQDNGVSVHIPAGTVQISQLGDMNPPGSPLTQLVVHPL
jgi:hypothetical protein